MRGLVKPSRSVIASSYMDKQLLTVNEVLQVVRVSRFTLYQLWRDDKGPPFINIGRRRLVRKADLDDWIEALEPRGSSTATIHGEAGHELD